MISIFLLLLWAVFRQYYQLINRSYMKKTILLLVIPIFLVSILGIASCKNKSQKSKKEEQKKIETERVDSIKSQIKEYPLPTSAEVIKMLSDLEVGYIFGICNPPANSRKYITSKSRAANMGVFGADLSYATLYNIPQEILNYLEAIRSLANELNMSGIYDETLHQRLEQNRDNKDELVKILTTAFDDTYKYMSKNDQQPLALLVVGGAWVEGMYLTTHVSYAAYQFAGISKNLLDQKKSLNVYYEVTQPYMTDPMVSEFVRILDPIKKVYEGLDTSLTEQNITEITKAIEGIREQIVK